MFYNFKKIIIIIMFYNIFIIFKKSENMTIFFRIKKCNDMNLLHKSDLRGIAVLITSISLSQY